MNYTEARVYLDEVSKYGSVLGLESMRELLDRLGNPQNELKFIHISGTNGKGSVLAYLSTILTGAGYRTGRYISPTLFSYRERIQVDQVYIEKESLARHVTAIAAAAEDMQKAGLPSPTVFEVETALAFLYFKEKHCDIVTLEVGCGGLLDATNVITTTLVEVIASISMDHMDVLGDTLAKIAAQKAGIIKPNTLVVSAHQEPEAAQVIEETCQRQHSGLQVVDEGQLRDVHYGADMQTFSYKNWENMTSGLGPRTCASSTARWVCPGGPSTAPSSPAWRRDSARPPPGAPGASRPATPPRPPTALPTPSSGPWRATGRRACSSAGRRWAR